MAASEVFALRLRETRRARDLSQSEVARRMTEAGRPMGKASLLRVENDTRGPTLDEAFALAQVLFAATANLLSPPEGALVALTDKVAVDGGGLRNWLLTGVGIPVWPEAPRDEDRGTLRVWFEDAVTAHAVALADAYRARDKAGIRAAVEAILASVGRYEQALKLAGKEA